MPEDTKAETSASKKYKVLTQTRHEIVILLDGEREYQITDFRLHKLNDFSCTLRLKYQNQFYISDTSLTKPKSRQNFIYQVREMFLLSEEIVSGDLSEVMSVLETAQREYIKQIEGETSDVKAAYVLLASDEKKAIDILSNGDVFKTDLLKDLDRIGYVGDEIGKQILYLAAVSRLLPKPISVLSVANSSAGKSFAQDTVLSLFPDDEIYSYSRITPMSLSHFKKDDLKNKIMRIDELSGIDAEAMYQLRSFLSTGVLSVAFTAINRTTGVMETLHKQVNGPVSVFTTTTHEDLIDDETRTRFLILPVDETAEQTLRVMQSMVGQNTRRGLTAHKEKQIILNKYKAIQKVLKPVHVLIPDDLAKQITFNHERVSYKRKFTGYLSLIYSIALHRQYQRKRSIEKIGDEAVTVIDARKQDIVDANRIITRLLHSSLGDLNPVHQKLISDINSYCKQESKTCKLKPQEVLFTRRDLRQFSGWEHKPLHRAINHLLEMEYISKAYGTSRSRHQYKLADTDDSGGVKLNLWNGKTGTSKS